MKLSIVTTLYQSASYIAEFHRRASIVAKQLVEENYEIIFVNDGSPDNSLEIAVELTKTDKHVAVVDLSRNFGHYKAMMTGLAHAKGKLIFLIDSDLEEEPEWLIPFAKQMQDDHCDVVYGIQEKRKGKLFEQLSGWLFYRIFNIFTGFALPKNIVTARLMTNCYVNALLSHKERELFIAGIWHITGFTQSSQKIKKHNTSETTYSLRKKIIVLVNAITSFSVIPLISIFYTGISIFTLAIFYVIYLCIRYIFLAQPLTGWTSVIVSIWLLGGMTISFLGVMGIYLSKIFIETKQRPYTIIKQIYAREQN